jgi:hypothetical protein
VSPKHGAISKNTTSKPNCELHGFSETSIDDTIWD